MSLKSLVSISGVVALAAATLFTGGGTAIGDQADSVGLADADVIYRVTATDGRLIRRVVGPITNDVEGVPAKPVDAFNWQGKDIDSIEGRVSIDVDPVSNQGRIKAQWTDRNGHWKLEQTMFAPPPHPSGLEIGTSGSETVLIEGDPVLNNVYLHGDTTAAEPLLPTVFNYLATWGPAEVTLNGEPFENPFDGPAPLWVAHFMVTEGVRNADGTVRTVDGEIYQPMKAGSGVTDRDDREVHLTFHDAPGPEATNNFPPPLDFFYHVQFEVVDIRIDDRS